jgi:hypothetical protein
MFEIPASERWYGGKAQTAAGQVVALVPTLVSSTHVSRIASTLLEHAGVQYTVLHLFTTMRF